ncbi:MATE family efflux transporter [Eubacteriales bacterium OttesenSCG-928-N13]|nr:MATE family efflux transporter [Eubacteriales bacterium OttesenSCG-928-N13]
MHTTDARLPIITRDRAFYQEFFPLFAILVLQNVILTAVNLADNIMLGSFSQAALSGVAPVNNVQFVVQNVIVGIGDAMVVLASQYWGQNRTEPIRRMSSIAMRVAMGFALVMFALVSIFPEWVLGRFTSEATYITEGVTYLNLIRFTYPIFAITSILLATMRSVQTVKIAFYISLSTLLVNCGINYVLIFGNFGAPRLGVTGAAIGTLVARIIEVIIVLIYVLRIDQKLRIKLKSYLVIDRELLKDYLKVALPVIFVSAMWGLNTALQTMILGHIPTDVNNVAIAANSAATNLMMLLKVASVGAAAASAVVIGKAVGRGNIRKVKEYARTLQCIYLCISVITGVTLYLIRTPMLGLYSELSPEALEMANSFLLVMCFTAAGMAYQMPTSTGIIRGGGNSKYCMVLDIISIWGIVLPLSALAAFVFKWPPIAVVICLNADQVFKCIPNAIKCNRFTWIRSLTRS